MLARETGERVTWKERAKDVACIALAQLFKSAPDGLVNREETLASACEILRPLGGHDVEHVKGPGDTSFSYCNVDRDTYDVTIVLYSDGEFEIVSWGTALEKLEEAHTFETGEISCGYCGEFGPTKTRTNCCGANASHLCVNCGRCSSCGGVA